MFDRALWYIFVLSVLLMLAVYYIGVKSDATAVGSALNSMLLTVTGRLPNGQFASYPTTA
jgi:hypothetical protein